MKKNLITLLEEDRSISTKAFAKLEKIFESFRTLQTLNIENAVNYCFLEYLISKQFSFGAGESFLLNEEMRFKIKMILQIGGKPDQQAELAFKIPENEIAEIQKKNLNGVVIFLSGKKISKSKVEGVIGHNCYLLVTEKIRVLYLRSTRKNQLKWNEIESFDENQRFDFEDEDKDKGFRQKRLNVIKQRHGNMKSRNECGCSII